MLSIVYVNIYWFMKFLLAYKELNFMTTFFKQTLLLVFLSFPSLPTPLYRPCFYFQITFNHHFLSIPAPLSQPHISFHSWTLSHDPLFISIWTWKLRSHMKNIWFQSFWDAITSPNRTLSNSVHFPLFSQFASLDSWVKSHGLHVIFERDKYFIN